MTKKNCVLLCGAVSVLVFMATYKPVKQAPPSAKEVMAAIWEADYNLHKVKLPGKLLEAQGNTRKLSEVWVIANTYKLPEIANQANQQLETLVWPRTKFASRKKHIDRLLKKVPEGSPIAKKLLAFRDTLPEK